jgi:2-haloacid dehalogenase
MIDVRGVEALTFDCYGTLIDWESGLRSALRRALGANSARVPDEALLNLYGAIEALAERGEFRAYRVVLRGVLAEMAGRFAVAVREPDALAESIAQWPAFEDSPAALAALAARFRLCVVSNIDDDLFEHSRRKLVAGGGWDFHQVVTAQQVRSYKPGKAHFKEALRRLGLPAAKVVHVAQSLYHDIAPAREMGFRTVWVNRQAGRGGATPPAAARPDLEVPDLATLARVVGVA